MLKNLTRSLAFAVSLFACTSQALPIVEADAFVSGDKKAVLETSTGLVWMDFGITNNKSYQQVISELDSTYQGWRLPTATEISNLWISLFSNQPGWFAFESFGMVRNAGDGLGNHLQSIMDIWGYNSLGVASVYQEDELILQYPIIGGFSTFQFDNGRYGQAMIYRALDGANDHSAIFFDLYDQSMADLDGFGPFANTLLVKSSNIEVPEPSTLLLLIMGLFGLIQRRRVVK
jgi:hypothetical protein